MTKAEEAIELIYQVYNPEELTSISNAWRVQHDLAMRMLTEHSQ